MTSFLSLELQDPLDQYEVVVTIRVEPNSGAKRQDREALVSLGVEGQFPLITKGKLGDLEKIVTNQWIAAAKQLNLDEVSQAQAESGTEPSNDVGGDDTAAEKETTAAVVEEPLIDEDDLF